MDRPQLTEQIGANLRAARLHSDTSLAAVAGDAGISTATLSRIENGKQSLDVTLLVVLAAIVGASPASIVGVGESLPSDERALVAALRAVEPAQQRRIMRAVERDGSATTPAAQLMEEVAEHLAAATIKLKAARRQMARERRRS
ncbi:MAG TPA: helix-turn-helix transcriptional regulator [Thermoanaerobaculia bacterium]